MVAKKRVLDGGRNKAETRFSRWRRLGVKDVKERIKQSVEKTSLNQVKSDKLLTFRTKNKVWSNSF